MERKDCITCGYTIPCFRCGNNEDYPAWVPNKLGTDLTSRPKEAKTGTTEEANHYMTSKQPIEIMQELMTAEQFQGFLWGNVIKYSMRIGRKGKAREDAGKCWQYAKWMVDNMDGKTIVPGGKS